ncbi:MAG: D-alanyl-D-alanine carboxypeptidase [Oscillospiraceae bacterium]|nr:D-alanyl-D-alanine carboxypeptidase [Oscillospiraceae bacterium]
MFRRKILGIVFSFFLTSIFTCNAFAVNTSAASAILMEQGSGRVLYEQQADEERLIASITKIMTTVVALENGDLKASYTVTQQDLAEGSSMYLTVGESLTLEELLYGVMLVSGNDAALAVAHCVSGDLSEFVDLMNDTARKIGMTHTSFANPNGLDAEGHFSSARDMALLTAYAMNNELFCRIASTASITIGERYLKNHNKLLNQYEGCIGVKTGFTKAAGRTLVSAAEREGMRLICVTLNDGNDWTDHTNLLDYGFFNYRRETVVNGGQVLTNTLVRDGTRQTIALMTERSLSYPLTGDEHLSVTIQVPVSVAAPIVPGQVIGSVCAVLDGEEVASVDLVAAEPVARIELSVEQGILGRLFRKR